VEQDAARRSAQRLASDVDAVTMVEFAVVFIETAAAMATEIEATAMSRKYGRLDFEDMRAEAQAAATGRRGRRK
jgi:hypothetical protein